MSHFIVSARKYRPIRFEEVVGQEHVSLTLKNALKTDHLAHAFLFCGPRGVGKTTCARILAKVINCEQNAKEAEPCGECNSCRSFEKNASFNIIELDAASNNGVDHIRNLVEQTRVPPVAGQYKVFIIDEVHQLSSAAFNAFLKTLEEPPEHAIFILATTEKHKILPTILSRCQIYDFRRISVEDIVAQLKKIAEKEGIKAEDQALHVIAQKADGGLRDALSIFDKMASMGNNVIEYQSVIDTLNVLDYTYFFDVVEHLVEERSGDVLVLFNTILEKGFEGDWFMLGLGEHLRNLFMVKNPQTVELLEVADVWKKKYVDQAGKISLSFIVTALDLINQCDIQYKNAKNKRLHVEMALVKLTYFKRMYNAASAQAEGEKKNN
ncbi:MAG: DNA polymerase III subunit gamma/tau [Saprospiraceae bacterium]|nr:DNA polymerase III subunit gamma/tau [Saprospiraceae bacterium]